MPDTITAVPATSIPASSPAQGVQAAASAGKSTTAATSASGAPLSAVASRGIAGYDRMSNGDNSAPLADGDISMDDFGDGASSDAPSSDRVTEVPANQPAPKSLDIQAEYEKHQAEQRLRETKTRKTDPAKADPAVDPTKPLARDYSQFLPEDAEIAKKLPNDLFDTFKGRLASVKQLSEAHAAQQIEVERLKQGGLPDSYFKHPQAISLLPEYQKTTQTVQVADFEAGVYEDALAAIENGQPYRMLLGYNKGQPVFRTVQPQADAEGNLIIDGAAKARLIRAMQSVSSQREAARSSQLAMEFSFNARHQKTLSDFTAHQAQMFPIFEKPEHAPLIKQTQAQLPDFIRNDPHMSGYVARGVLLVNALQAELSKLRAESAHNSALMSDRLAAGPAASLLSAANGGVAPDTKNQLSMSDFED